MFIISSWTYFYFDLDYRITIPYTLQINSGGNAFDLLMKAYYFKSSILPNTDNFGRSSSSVFQTIDTITPDSKPDSRPYYNRVVVKITNLGAE